MVRSFIIVVLISFVLSIAIGACPNGCTNRGICQVDGSCDCIDGYAGTDCSVRVRSVGSIYDCPTCFTFHVGSAEYYSGPSVRLPDSQLVSLNIDGVIKTYIGNGDAEMQSSGTSSSSYLLSPSISLKTTDYNTTGQFDSCGSWISRAIYDGSIVRCLYHAETNCNYDIGQTWKSLGYAESHDGGITFVRPNYPANQILSFNGTFLPGQAGGLGDGTMIRFVDPDTGIEYYYVYYTKVSPPAYISVARSPVTTGGVPGTWHKYNNGWSDQPNGIGGAESPINNINDATMYVHAPTGEILSVGNDYSGGHGGGGVQMSVSKDGLNFAYLPEPLYLSSDWRLYGWGNFDHQQGTVTYASLMGETGGYEMGNTFWLYYLYLKPGQDMNQRYFLRRKVTMTYNSVPSTVAQSRVALTTYVHKVTGEQYETREWVDPITGYAPTKVMGYVMTQTHVGAVGIVSCFNNGDYHVAKVGIECIGKGDVQMEAIGWMYAFRVPDTIAIYRCQVNGTGDRFISADIACEGRAPRQSTPFGYLLTGPPLSDDVGTMDVVLPRGSSWKYSSIQQPSNWTARSFNDAPWFSSTAPFANGYPVKAPSTFGSSNYYFRFNFSIDPRRTVVKALLTVGSDDQASVFLNGVMVDNDTQSTPRFAPNQAEVWNRRIWVPIDLLQRQSNVFAVQVTNGDNWAYFDLQFTVYYQDNIDKGCIASCGLNGNCYNNKCACDPFWGGDNCSTPLCTMGANQTIEVIIDSGDMWKYSSTAVFSPDSVISWPMPSYNDLTWAKAVTPAGAGYFQQPLTQRSALNCNPGTTTGADPYAYMFRKSVTIDIPPGYTISTATMGIASDDYHIAYINGYLVDGNLLPYISHQASFWNSVVNINPDILNNGSNIVAVRVQNWYSSTWMYFDLQLNITLQPITCVPRCSPTSCAAQHRSCGIIQDGCGDTIACGDCSSGHMCNVAIGQCVSIPSTTSSSSKIPTTSSSTIVTSSSSIAMVSLSSSISSSTVTSTSSSTGNSSTTGSLPPINATSTSTSNSMGNGVESNLISNDASDTAVPVALAVALLMITIAL